MSFTGSDDAWPCRMAFESLQGWTGLTEKPVLATACGLAVTQERWAHVPWCLQGLGSSGHWVHRHVPEGSRVNCVLGKYSLKERIGKNESTKRTRSWKIPDGRLEGVGRGERPSPPFLPQLNTLDLKGPNRDRETKGNGRCGQWRVGPVHVSEQKAG